MHSPSSPIPALPSVPSFPSTQKKPPSHQPHHRRIFKYPYLYARQSSQKCQDQALSNKSTQKVRVRKRSGVRRKIFQKIDGNRDTEGIGVKSGNKVMSEDGGREGNSVRKSVYFENNPIRVKLQGSKLRSASNQRLRSAQNLGNQPWRQRVYGYRNMGSGSRYEDASRIDGNFHEYTGYQVPGSKFISNATTYNSSNILSATNFLNAPNYLNMPVTTHSQQRPPSHLLSSPCMPVKSNDLALPEPKQAKAQVSYIRRQSPQRIKLSMFQNSYHPNIHYQPTSEKPVKITSSIHPTPNPAYNTLPFYQFPNYITDLCNNFTSYNCTLSPNQLTTMTTMTNGQTLISPKLNNNHNNNQQTIKNNKPIVFRSMLVENNQQSKKWQDEAIRYVHGVKVKFNTVNNSHIVNQDKDKYKAIKITNFPGDKAQVIRDRIDTFSIAEKFLHPTSTKQRKNSVPFAGQSASRIKMHRVQNGQSSIFAPLVNVPTNSNGNGNESEDSFVDSNQSSANSQKYSDRFYDMDLKESRKKFYKTQKEIVKIGAEEKGSKFDKIGLEINKYSSLSVKKQANSIQFQSQNDIIIKKSPKQAQNTNNHKISVKTSGFSCQPIKDNKNIPENNSPGTISTKISSLIRSIDQSGKANTLILLAIGIVLVMFQIIR